MKIKKTIVFVFLLFATLICALSCEILAITNDADDRINVSHALNRFDASLLRTIERVAASGANVFISSFSVSTVMAMLLPGAANKTYTEIHDALGYTNSGLSNEEILSGYRRLLDDLSDPAKTAGNNLSAANLIAVQKNFPILSTYLDNITEYFGSQVMLEDFAKNAAAATDELNKWVDEETRGKISKLFDEPLPDATKLVLMNAIYFRGIWKTKFDVKHTQHDAQFRVTREQTVPSSLMMVRSKFRYAQFADGAELIEIPYKNETLSMFVLLPSNDLFNSIDRPIIISDWIDEFGDDWNKRIAQMQKRDIVLRLPKFRIEATYTLNDALASIGIRRVFSAECDLSNIDGQQDLRVSKVAHKTFIEVNEEGSEAAAVSGVVIEKTSILHHRPIQFVADRPFMFVIRDNMHGVNIFSGVINKP